MTKWKAFKENAAWVGVAAWYVVCWPFYQVYKRLKPQDENHNEGDD
ncbi:hypothetical protein [Halomonas sp. SL1]|nr:hypothetical protein [Halomonas sp. SL1]